ncbi:MAG: universal stress protein, partial [Nitrospira sp.]|nr:universal stress protein [Nitrospira sp.]
MRILCAVDESEFSLWALECIGKLFRHSVSELVLLHAVDPRILRGGGGKRPRKHESGTKDISQKLEAAGQKVLTGCAHRIEVAL